MLKLTLVTPPARPTVRILQDPDTVLNGPATMEQFEEMSRTGQFAQQQADATAWRDARDFLAKMDGLASDTRLADNERRDHNRAPGQVALGDNVHAKLYLTEEDGFRHQERFYDDGEKIEREYVEAGGQAMAGYAKTSKTCTEVTVYTALPNGAIREERQDYPPA